ncbi:5-hydroxytryptamine receptor 1A [Brachionus plicatilis]|uniref:5-hydroxytryptamine receptor 1A n=1 Tax=Brachionus plicatilis TaxID=10195 RepID=A0A3M7R560_BRAPC|nr:5-hydroxytryptamine receptor 1A [Brachionus plicatilis]
MVFVGNLLIILVIRLKKSLYENNTLRIVLSLSVADLFLSISVLPFTTYAQLNYPEWGLGFYPCAFWLANDLQLKTTSIYHLCSITYERYLSIAKPMLFRINIQKRIMHLVLFNWSASFALITLPFLVLLTADTHSVYAATCSISSSVFVAYFTIITFWVPLTIMMFFGSRAVYLIRKIDKSHLKMNCKLLTDVTPRNSFLISESSKDSRHSVQCLDVKAQARKRANSLNYIYKRRKKENFKLKNIPTITVMEVHQTSPDSGNFGGEFGSVANREESQMSDDSGLVLRSEGARRPSRLSAFRLSIFGNPIRKELKAQKTLTIALIVFLFSYFPYFTFLTLMSFMKLADQRWLSQDAEFVTFVFYLTSWLAYSSAAINPLLQFLLNNNLKNSLKNNLFKNKK